MQIPSLSSGTNSPFQGSSSAIGGTAQSGAQRFGNVKFGSMATGIDARWLIGAAVVIFAMFFAFLVWG